jgi:phosphoribosyl 1,2-cyclic phosphodiesterase
MRYGGNTSCVEVRCGDQLLILDAGSGLRLLGEELLREAGSRPIEATLLLSHTHWDHIQGLPFFAPGYSERNRVRILSAHGRGARMQRALANQMSPMHFPVGLEQMRGLAPVAELDRGATTLHNLVLRTLELNHPGGCSGFRIEADGKSLGYLPDHEPYRTVAGGGSPAAGLAPQELLEFVHGLDLLILDTQYTAEEYTHRFGWGHGCLPDSVQLAIEAGVRRLVLFHHDPAHDDERIDTMVETARALARRSNLLVDAAIENETLVLMPANPLQTPILSARSPSGPKAVTA